MKLKHQIRSFKYAFHGIVFFFRNESKAWIHSIATTLVVLLGIRLNLNRLEWVLIIMAIGLVFICEIFNTAIEKICDTIPDKFDKIRGKSKDMAAGAVLISAITAVATAIFIFAPKIIALF